MNQVFGCELIPEDGPELPRGCVPYLPCSVDTLLRLVEGLAIDERDVFVDLGSGVGRAAAVVHLLSGAGVLGVEVQSSFVEASWALAKRLRLERFGVIHGDAALLARYLLIGTVFFLNCPFGGERLGSVLAALEEIARTRRIRVCTLDLPLPPCAWLNAVPGFEGALQAFESTLHEPARSEA